MECAKDNILLYPVAIGYPQSIDACALGQERYVLSTLFRISLILSAPYTCALQ